MCIFKNCRKEMGGAFQYHAEPASIACDLKAHADSRVSHRGRGGRGGRGGGPRGSRSNACKGQAVADQTTDPCEGGHPMQHQHTAVYATGNTLSALPGARHALLRALKHLQAWENAGTLGGREHTLVAQTHSALGRGRWRWRRLTTQPGRRPAFTCMKRVQESTEEAGACRN